VDAADKGRDWLVPTVTKLPDEVPISEADETVTAEHDKEPTFDVTTLRGDEDKLVSEGTVTSFMGTTFVTEDIPVLLDELADDNEDIPTEVPLYPELESLLAEIWDCCTSLPLTPSLFITISLSADDDKFSLVLLLSDK
jgi:hypothetical protein